MESKLQDTQAKNTTDGDLAVLYFAWSKVVDCMNVEGATVEDLKLKINGTSHISEIGFKNFLRRILSLKLDVNKMSDHEKDVYNQLFLYAQDSADVKEEVVVDTSQVTLFELIERAQNEAQQ